MILKLCNVIIYIIMLFGSRPDKVSMGRLDSVEWNGGMEQWNGIVE